MEKYKQYIETQWWNGIKKRDIDTWIQNFKANDELARIILDHVIFYNNMQLKEYTRCLINKMREYVYSSTMRSQQYKFVSDHELERNWKKYIDSMKIIPAEREEDVASSAHKIIGYWRSAFGKGDAILSRIVAIGKCYECGIRKFVLVDDFSGSGKQMCEILNRKVYINGRECELGKIGDTFQDVEIMVAVYVIHKKAKELIEKQYPKVRLLYIDLIDEEMDFFNERSEIYADIKECDRKNIVSSVKSLHDRLMNENVEMQKLSSYILNIPVVFEHGCPNNALLLLFAHSANWHQLFKRGEEI